MARYRLLASSYINEGLRAAGDVVDVDDDFVPGPHMVPYEDAKGVPDKAAKAAKDKAAKERPQAAPGDPDYIGSMIAHTLEDGSTNGRVSVASAHPATGAPGVIVDGDGHVRGVTATVAEPPQAPFAKLPGAPEAEMEKAVADDAAAKDGKGPVAAEAAAANKRAKE